MHIQIFSLKAVFVFSCSEIEARLKLIPYLLDCIVCLFDAFVWGLNALSFKCEWLSPVRSTW